MSFFFFFFLIFNKKQVKKIGTDLGTKTSGPTLITSEESLYHYFEHFSQINTMQFKILTTKREGNHKK